MRGSYSLSFSVPQEGGYGVYVIRSVTNSVEYDALETTGITLTMMKRRGR